MSLVSEALKKAEREAAARDARAKGQPAPFEAPLQPYRSRQAGGRNRNLVAALALGCAAAAIALLLLRPTGKEEAPVMDRTAAAPEARALPSVPPAAVDPVAGPAAAPADVPTAFAVANPFARPRSGARPDAPATKPASGAADSLAPPLAATPLPRTPQKTPPPSPSGSQPAAPKAPAAPVMTKSNGSGDFLRSVEFADGSKLELGGIVYSEAAPFAYLNGRLVGIGEFVLGRRIERIERDKVILAGDSGEITLRLKAP